jgi:hypothetical protein
MIALYIDLYADCIKLQEDLESDVALYQTLLRSPLLLNQFECFYHCFVLVGEQVILFVIHMTYSI